MSKRLSRHQPTEISSKVAPPRLRDLGDTLKRRRRGACMLPLDVARVHWVRVADPRFDALSGEFSEHLFERAYSFVDDIQVRPRPETGANRLIVSGVCAER